MERETGIRVRVSHVIVRATYLPNTVRCIIDLERRHPPYLGWANSDHVMESGINFHPVLCRYQGQCLLHRVRAVGLDGDA